MANPTDTPTNKQQSESDLLPAREQALACLLGLLQQRSVLRVVAGVRLEGFKYPK